ncbi:glycosyltransferase [Gemmatimonas sp.]|uniref:glycosyltransferase n=1 Tax=Gemmatimonas sp. TaxID=1962908 RepID=UPI003562E9D0
MLGVTEWFGETSGGIRTYLLEKANYVASRPWLQHTVVVPGLRDRITDADGVRLYRLTGPRIPGQRPYRFMLATRTGTRIVKHERPDVIEIGSPFIVPWIVKRATGASDVPLVYFSHTNVPRMFARDEAPGTRFNASYIAGRRRICVGSIACSPSRSSRRTIPRKSWHAWEPIAWRRCRLAWMSSASHQVGASGSRTHGRASVSRTHH